MFMVICTVSCLNSSVWVLIDPFDVSFELALERLASKEVIVLTEEFDKLGRISVSSPGTAVLPVSDDHLCVRSSLSSSLSRSCINCSGLGGRFGEASLGGGAPFIGSTSASFGDAEIGALALRTASFERQTVRKSFLSKETSLHIPFFMNLHFSALLT